VGALLSRSKGFALYRVSPPLRALAEGG
jgi:hypothetical protein